MSVATRQAGNFLGRQLEQKLPKLYEKKFPRKWAYEGAYLPAIPDLEMGAETLVEETITETGEASIYSDLTDDIATAEIVTEEFDFRAVCVVSCIKYSVLQLLKAQKAGRDIRTRKLGAGMRSIAERIHRLAVFGSAKHGMQGMFNSRNIPKDISSYDPNTATFDDHLDFAVDNMTRVENDSNNTEGVRTIMLPTNVRKQWAKSRTGGTSDSVIKYLFENFGTQAGGTLQNIVTINEARSDQLEQQGVLTPGSNQDLIFFSSQDPESLERHFYPIDQLEPQLHGMTYKVYMFGGTSEMVDHYPEGNLEVLITKAN